MFSPPVKTFLPIDSEVYIMTVRREQTGQSTGYCCILAHFMFAACIILVLIVKISVTRDLSEASHKIHQLYFSSGARAQSSEYSYSLIDCFSLALS